jgi:hypothetical protein
MSKKIEQIKFYFHGCSYSSVQPIIHYGLQSTNALTYGLFICSVDFRFSFISGDQFI